MEKIEKHNKKGNNQKFFEKMVQHFCKTLTLCLPLKIIIFVCLTWNSIIKITLLQHYQGKGTRWGLGGTSLCVSVTVVADWMGDNLRCVIVRTLFILISKQVMRGKWKNCSFKSLKKDLTTFTNCSSSSFLGHSTFIDVLFYCLILWVSTSKAIIFTGLDRTKDYRGLLWPDWWS